MFRTVSHYHPEEAKRIGRMLAGYSELEYGLFACIESAGVDFDSSFKVMFRTRGETQRLEVADALGRYKFHALGFGTDFEMGVGGVRKCLKIRNQYAHSHWFADEKSLNFFDMEENAKLNILLTTENTRFVFRSLTPDLVKRQEDFFNYVSDFLIWLQMETDRKRGTPTTLDVSKPKQLEPPLLYMRPG